jgi:hypothetical protein
VFDDCERLEDLKTHAKRFCFQVFNLLIHEKELNLSMSFLRFLEIKSMFLETRTMSFAMVLFDMICVYLLKSPYRVC